MPKFPADTPQRKIGSKARAIVHYALDAEHWDYREETGNDYGRDCTIELSRENKWNNEKIEGQIKGTKQLKILKNGLISFQMEVKTLNYAINSPNAFVLFLVDTVQEDVYFLPIQDYFIDNTSLLKKLEKDYHNVHIPKEQTLDSCEPILQSIARKNYSFVEPDRLIRTK